MIKLRKFLIIFFVAALSINFFAAYSWAMLLVDKTRLEINAPGGKEHIEILTITNKSTSKAEVEISNSFYRQLYTPGTIEPKTKSTLKSAMDFITFDANHYLINPEERIEIPIKIHVPENLSGEYLASILLDYRADSQKEKMIGDGAINVDLVNRLAIPLYLSIEGTEKRSAKITDFRFVNYDEDGIALDIINRFEVTVQNTGNTHIRASGVVTIFDLSGQIIQNVTIGKTFPIFTYFEEKIPVFIEPLESGDYKVVATVNIGDNQMVQEMLEIEKW